MNHIPVIFPSKPGGFTLVELLVVVAVIGILCALIFPFANSSLEKGKSISCVSNLRQIGTAVELYAAENNQLLPPISDTGGVLFQQEIASYLGFTIPLRDLKKRKELGVFCCPSDDSRQPSAFRSYAINYYVGRSLDFTSKNIARRIECQNPGKILYLVDGFRNATDPTAAARFAWSSYGIGSNETIGMSFRHEGKANALWLDGHISAVTLEDTQNNTTLLYPK